MTKKEIEIERAVIELDGVKLLADIAINQIEEYTTVESLQTLFGIFQELLERRISSLKMAVYGGEQR